MCHNKSTNVQVLKKESLLILSQGTICLTLSESTRRANLVVTLALCKIQSQC